LIFTHIISGIITKTDNFFQSLNVLLFVIWIKNNWLSKWSFYHLYLINFKFYSLDVFDHLIFLLNKLTYLGYPTFIVYLSVNSLRYHVNLRQGLKVLMGISFIGLVAKKIRNVLNGNAFHSFSVYTQKSFWYLDVSSPNIAKRLVSKLYGQFKSSYQ